jgi:hypothetical protein
LQQIWPVQSLLCSQLLGQVAEQNPLQQMGEVLDPAQSRDVLHAFGHVVVVGFRQMPLGARSGSSLPAAVQQISPPAVLQSVSAEQPVGQSSACVQIGVL